MLNSMTQKTLFKFEPAFGWALIVVLACAMVSLFVNLQLGFFLLFFTTIGWWAWLNPITAFFMLIVLSPLLPMFKVTQTISTITLIKDVLIGTLFMRLFLWPLLTQRLPYRRNVLWAPIILLLLWTTVETLRADALLVGVLRAREIMLYVLLYVVALYLPKGKTFWRELTLWVGLAAASVISVAVYQWHFAPDSAVLRFDPARSVWIPRISSTFGHPSVFGHTLVLLTTFAFAATMVIPRRMAKLGAIMGSVVLAICIYLTYSRAVWLGLGAAIASMTALWLLRSYAKRRNIKRLLKAMLVISITAVAALILLWKFTTVGVLLSSGFDTSYKSNSERLEFLARLIGPLTNAEALVGKGLGDVTEQNFREVDLTTFDVASGAARSVQLAKNRTLVDNQYLKTFIEMGLVGLLIYTWIFIRLLKNARRLYLTPAITEPFRTRCKIFGLASFGFLAAFLIQATFIDIWDIYPTNAFFWIIAGLLSGECVWLTQISQHSRTRVSTSGTDQHPRAANI